MGLRSDRLPHILRMPVVCDDTLSAQFGHPVGDIDGIKIMFLHYSTFEQAVAAWRRRVKRINLDQLLLVCVARDDLRRVLPYGSHGTFTVEHLEHFRALPYPRLLLTNTVGREEPFAVVPPTADKVEDLHSWLPLSRALGGTRIRQITAGSAE